jgi:hypothetical protein
VTSPFTTGSTTGRSTTSKPSWVEWSTVVTESPESIRDWHEEAHARSAAKRRRRNAIVLWLLALVVLLGATASFVIPMLVTP